MTEIRQPYNAHDGVMSLDLYEDDTTNDTAWIQCEGCGRDRLPKDMQVVATKVNLRDNTTRDIVFCGVSCCEFWDDTEPGDWVELDSGEEVQCALWQCVACDGVYDFGMVKIMLDIDYDDCETVVCSFCRKREKERFQERN
jgi:hypothetical protein